MPFPRAGRPPLRFEHLEDRLAPTATPQSFDPTRVLVTFADPGPDAAHAAELQQSPLAAGVDRLGFGVYRVDLAAGQSVATAATALAQLPGVAAAGPDYRVTPDAVPNDPGYPGQWAYSVISAAAAWGVTTGTGQTIVAVVDTGVDAAHPDLAANMVPGFNFMDNTTNTADDAGHGTHVAGILGAVGGNGVGVTGVDWHVKVMPLKFMSASGGYTSDAVRAMDYAVSHGARVINESWGGGGNDPALAAAIGRAQAAGVIVVTAAGNYSSNNDATSFYPGDYTTQFDNVVSVAATDSSDRLASFSNFGATTVTVAAPGVNIASTLPGGRYGAMSGTSMATPFVSGALALLWDRHPDWNYRQVIAKLKSSVDVLPSLAGKVATGGRLDLAKLLDAPPPAPPAPPVVPPPPPVSTTPGPRVVGSAFGGAKAGVFDRVWVKFSEAVNPATFTPSDVSLAGPAGALGVSAIVPVAGKGNTEFYLMFSRPQTAQGTYSVAVGPDVRDAAGSPMDQNGNGVGGEAGDRFTASAALGTPTVPPAVPPSPPAPAPSAKTYSAAGLPAAVNDRRTTRIDFAVTDSFKVSGLTVTVDIAHARTSDLNIRIVAPDGRSVTLFNRRGGVNLSGTTFDDAAGQGVASASGSFAGTFRPEQLLSLFNGMTARGLWSVQVFDLADGVTGTVNAVRLNFATQTGQSVAPPVQALGAADLRGASDAVQAAVLAGRGDAVAQPDAITELAEQCRPVRVG